MSRYAIGLDYGTNSVRALLVNLETGEETATSVFNYPTGDEGVVYSPHDPHLARQFPRDYELGAVATIRDVLSGSGIDPTQVVGIGVDTTGSSPIPVDRDGIPLAHDPRFADNPDAYCYLWKDHTGTEEAIEITAKASRYPYLLKCGGTYSSEWFWAKILHAARHAPEVFDAAYSWVELADYVPAWLTGTTAKPKRSVCAAGHKAMYSAEWGGLPSEEFLASLDPRLAELRGRLYDGAVPSDQAAGLLTPECATELGLPAGIPVAVGAFDAHLGAVGSGIRPGTLVKILGTSTCDCMVHPATEPLADIPGVCGIVPGSVLPGQYGIEAGQSAVGDLFNWWVRTCGQTHEVLSEAAAGLDPGESGLLALDWNNGNRTVLVNQRLTGLILGQTLRTSPAEIYRALIEATAFGALKIIQRIEEYGVRIERVVNCGGIAEKSALVMQIYADILNRPMYVSRSAQTCALGSAIAASVVAGIYPDFATAQSKLTGVKDTVYHPNPTSVAVYAELFELYSALHDEFGGVNDPDLAAVMPRLMEIQERALAAK